MSPISTTDSESVPHPSGPVNVTNTHQHQIEAESAEDLSAAMNAIMNPILPDRPVHEGFMREAIAMAELALRSDETPVGCVFVRNGKVIARGMNGTNATLNGTRHAEFVALSQIISKHGLAILNETDLYVTVEPCIMCASALRQYRIRAVYFGCLNERFGGCGGVMRLCSDPSIDPPYPVYGGIFREEAIMLLRRFYVQENDKAPEPKPKKNRELKTEILPVEVAHSPHVLTPPATSPNELHAQDASLLAAVKKMTLTNTSKELLKDQDKTKEEVPTVKAAEDAVAGAAQKDDVPSTSTTNGDDSNNVRLNRPASRNATRGA